MENDPQSIAFARDKRAHAVAVIDGISAALAMDRPMMDGEYHAIPLPQRYHTGAGLGARPLFGHHELAAREILPRLRQQDRHLQWKDMFAVKVPVQAIIIARPVFQQ